MNGDYGESGSGPPENPPVGRGEGYRMSSYDAMRDRIDRLRLEADNLEELLGYLSSADFELNPEADQGLWGLVIRTRGI